MFLLTTCNVCAAPLPDMHTGCPQCDTPFCGERCARYAQRNGGHAEICEAIAEAGGAEQRHANQKYAEAAAAAVAAANVPAGATCFICMDDGGDDLVRSCEVCGGGLQFAHLSCLVQGAR